MRALSDWQEEVEEVAERPTSSPLWMRLQELMMILFSFSTDTTSVMQLGEHEWLMYLSITHRSDSHLKPSSTTSQAQKNIGKF